MSKLFILLILVVSFFLLVGSFYPFMFALFVFVLGGALHAFAEDLYYWIRENTNGPKALDEQQHHHATGH